VLWWGWVGSQHVLQDQYQSPVSWGMTWPGIAQTIMEGLADN